jgi:hypothetical protein
VRKSLPKPTIICRLGCRLTGWDAVDKYGLNLDSNVRSGLELLDTPHSKFWSRYPSEEAAQVILIGEFDADVDVLIKAVGIAIYGGNP